jgi:hypothetical protein
MAMSWRPLAILVSAGILAACGDTATSPSVESSGQVPTGAVVLRLGYQSSCALSTGASIIPDVRTRITVTRSGSEWIGTATSPASGDVEVRFHTTTVSPAGTFVEGTISGAAIHLPELIAVPAWDSRVAFGSGARIFGVVFTAGALATTNGVSGSGSGPVTLSDSAGRSCSGLLFSWAIFPPMS